MTASNEAFVKGRIVVPLDRSVWTLIALGVTALFSVILSVRGLWSLPWGQSR